MADKTLPNRDYYDRFAAGYDRGRDEGYHLMIDEIESALVLPWAEGKRVLEVGCGTGLILSRIAPVARKAVGVDLSPEMLQRARERGLTVELADATELPFEDATFDLVYSFKVLSHVEDLAEAIREISRVLRPGGRAFIELYNRYSLRYAIRRLRGGKAIASGIHDNQVFVRFYSPVEMQRYLPEELRLEKLHGVRVVTTLPSMLKWPVVGSALRQLEVRLCSSSLARFGGFVVLECLKSEGGVS